MSQTNFQVSSYNIFLNPEECFFFSKTSTKGIAPNKTRVEDAGYDLHIVNLLKVDNGIYYYDTGINVRPPKGFYFELVPRSSMTKTGYTLANNVGVIDATYTGSIIVALRKFRDDAPDLTLPMKLVQLLPRKLYNFNPILIEDDSIEKEEIRLDNKTYKFSVDSSFSVADKNTRKIDKRGDSGGLGSKQFNLAIKDTSSKNQETFSSSSITYS